LSLASREYCALVRVRGKVAPPGAGRDTVSKNKRYRIEKRTEGGGGGFGEVQDTIVHEVIDGRTGRVLLRFEGYAYFDHLSQTGGFSGVERVTFHRDGQHVWVEDARKDERRKVPIPGE
jgi:hypothetical protein